MLYNVSYRRQKGVLFMEEKRFTLRMSQDLFDQMKERAKQNKRSVAKEIEFAIEEFLKSENQDKPKE